MGDVVELHGGIGWAVAPCGCQARWDDGELLVDTCEAHDSYARRQGMKLVRKLGIPLAEP